MSALDPYYLVKEEIQDSVCAFALFSTFVVSRGVFFFLFVFFSPSFVQNAVKTFQMIFQYAGEDIARHVCAMGTTTSLRN
jgi:hypothetical protein